MLGQNRAVWAVREHFSIFGRGVVEIVPADMGADMGAPQQKCKNDLGAPQAHQRELAAMTSMTVSCRVLAEQRGDNHGEVVGLPARAPDSAQVRGSRTAVRGRVAWQERADCRLGTRPLLGGATAGCPIKGCWSLVAARISLVLTC